MEHSLQKGSSTLSGGKSAAPQRGMAKIVHYGVEVPRKGTALPSGLLLILNDFRAYHAPNLNVDTA